MLLSGTIERKYFLSIVGGISIQDNTFYLGCILWFPGIRQNIYLLLLFSLYIMSIMFLFTSSVRTPTLWIQNMLMLIIHRIRYAWWVNNCGYKFLTKWLLSMKETSSKSSTIPRRCDGNILVEAINELLDPCLICLCGHCCEDGLLILDSSVMDCE